jgi:hypothetical protein
MLVRSFCSKCGSTVFTTDELSRVGFKQKPGTSVIPRTPHLFLSILELALLKQAILDVFQILIKECFVISQNVFDDMLRNNFIGVRTVSVLTYKVLKIETAFLNLVL